MIPNLRNVSRVTTKKKHSQKLNIIETSEYFRFHIYKQACTQNFSFGGEGTDPEAVYNLCFILKTVTKIIS